MKKLVKEIELTQDQVALVDDWDYEHLNQYRWYANFDKRRGKYFARRNIKIVEIINGKPKSKWTVTTMGRQIMKPKKGMVVIYINHNTLDCRKKNLMVVTKRQSTQHRKRGSSKYTGVYWDKKREKFTVNVMYRGKLKFLGSFTDEKEAFKAYEKALCELTGEQPVCRLKAKKKSPTP